MHFSEILKFIGDYGLAIVISAIVLYFLFRLANLAFKKLEDTWGHKEHEKKLDARNRVSEEIQNLIDLFLVQSHGNRVMVVEFSNTDTSMAYLPFRFMTCTYEVCKERLMPMAQRVQKLATSLFTPFFSALQQNEYCIYDIDSKEIRMGGAMYDLMLEQGENRSLCVMLRSSKGNKNIGYISLKTTDDFTDDDIRGIQLLAKQVSILLSVADK